LGVTTVAELVALSAQQRSNQDRSRYITFQRDIKVEDAGAVKVMRPRTLEEAFAYQNFTLLRSGAFQFGLAVPADLEQVYQEIFELVKSDTFKKTDFAMAVLSNTADWKVPNYVVDGLGWLELRLHGPVVES
jgi:hypothetical protein